MTRPLPEIKPVGDTGLLLRFGDRISDDIHDQVLAAERLMDGNKIPGLGERIPSYAALYVSYDVDVISYADAREALLALDWQHASASGMPNKSWDIPICFDPEFAFDLQGVADLGGVTPGEAQAALLRSQFKVYMFGFAPGYAYLGGTDTTIQVPRKAAPRRDIPKGSVMIAGPQCLICPLVMPSGWHVIGRTPFDLLDRDGAQPSPLSVGDRLRFVEVDRIDYEAAL